MFWKCCCMWLYICACKQMQFCVRAQTFLKLASQNLMLYLIYRRRRSSASLSGSSSSSSSSRSRSPPKKPPKRTVSSPPRKTRRLSPSASPPRRRHRPSPPASPPPKPRRSPTPQQSNRARKSRGSVSPSRTSGNQIKICIPAALSFCAFVVSKMVCTVCMSRKACKNVTNCNQVI